MSLNRDSRSRKKRALIFWPILIVLTTLASAVASELMIRLVVPDEVFWPIGNIYAADANAAVGYTLRRSFHGVAFAYTDVVHQKAVEHWAPIRLHVVDRYRAPAFHENGLGLIDFPSAPDAIEAVLAWKGRISFKPEEVGRVEAESGYTPGG